MKLASPVQRRNDGFRRCTLRSLAWAVLLASITHVHSAGVLSSGEMLKAVSSKSGVCVQLGCDDSKRITRLAAGGKLLIHVLEAESARVREARAAWQADGLYGVVSVEHWTEAGLPYGDNLINLVIAENPGLVAASEMMRVLAPHGEAWIRQGDGWSVLRKPWPEEFDEWTHWRHGADGNMVSRDAALEAPTGLRWVAGPAQDAGGQKWYYDHVLVSAQGRNFYVYETEIVARDSFNGSLLWRRQIKANTFREIGTEVPEFLRAKAKMASRISKVRPVALGDLLYVAAEGKLTALDAASGATVTEFGRVSQPRELILENGRLIVSETNHVRAYELSAKGVKWAFPIQAERILAGDGSVFCLAGDTIVALDLATGRERWRTVEARAEPATTCTYHDGVLAVEVSSWRDDPGGCALMVFSGQDGRLLWSRDHVPDMTHYKETRSFFANGLLWLQTEGNRIVGFDPVSGQQQKSFSSRGKHCATPVATERFFIAPECDFTDLATGSRSRARMFKSACRLPFIPANGLLNTFPVQCECYPMLRGYMGLAAEGPPKLASTPRLEKGPAFGVGAAPGPGFDPAAEWPIYRHDSYRSGATPGSAEKMQFHRKWSMQIAKKPRHPVATDWDGDPFVRGLITPPVVAGGRLVAAVPNEHRIVALDAATGKPQWTFTAGGRIDAPPTLHENLCLFGSHDGWVYCLESARGELVWRYRAAPQEARIMAYGQMESLWPVPGSVLVEGGIAYLAAGRHPMSDGGLRVLALQPRTGDVLWEKAITDLTLTNWYSPLLPTRKKVGLDFEPIDFLVRDGDGISMSRWRFRPDTGDYALALASIEYQSPKLAVPRGLWGYGIRQTKGVLAKPPAAFDETRLCVGTEQDAALLLAGGTTIVASKAGVLQAGAKSFKLPAPAVHDGMAFADGRLFVSTESGQVVCLE